MKLNSIKKHLSPYRIEQKRRTTINHAFASAIAPADPFNESRVRQAIELLGQDPDEELNCVYCGVSAETWDHLYPIVEGGESSGYGHFIENLVPSCGRCNSQKGNRNWRGWLETKEFEGKRERIKLLEQLSERLESRRKNAVNLRTHEPALMAKYDELRASILRLMRDADDVATELRKRIVQ